MAPAQPQVEVSSEGRSVATISIIAVSLVVGLCCVTAIGALLDVRRARVRKAQSVETGRTGYWVWFLGLSCYFFLLIPGIFMQLFQFKIAALGGGMVLQESSESTLTFIHLLATTGGWLGSTFLVVFAIVIPIAKITMFLVGEYWRNSSNPRHVRIARRCIITLQLVSKWACPDVFAYILMVFLIRSLQHPTTLYGLMQLDVGFSCFSLFCLGSTLSCLGISPPPAPASEETQPAKMRYGAAGLTRLAIFLLVAWVGLFTVGLFLPCMALRLDIEHLVENGTIPKNMLDFVINKLRLPELARADVSIWHCMSAFIRWAHGGDMNMLLGFVMLSVFVVALSAFDMLATGRIGFALLWRDEAATMDEQGSWLQPARMMRLSRVLKKLSMLDVLIAGVVVVVLSSSIYEAQGLVLSFRWGLACLVAAEVSRYASFALLSAALSRSDATGQPGSEKATSKSAAEAAQGPDGVSGADSNGDLSTGCSDDNEDESSDHTVVV